MKEILDNFINNYKGEPDELLDSLRRYLIGNGFKNVNFQTSYWRNNLLYVRNRLYGNIKLLNGWRKLGWECMYADEGLIVLNKNNYEIEIRPTYYASNALIGLDELRLLKETIIFLAEKKVS